ncbi:unnamed protein product [Trichobilharzia regenti]|nr:unnamed protein product [Trichobilharzia regenti]
MSQQVTMMATDVSFSLQPSIVAVCSGTVPQFITLVPGTLLKVMAFGPNGQPIQTSGVPQFMPTIPTSPVGMTINQSIATLQHQKASFQVTPQRRVTISQQQNTNGSKLRIVHS